MPKAGAFTFRQRAGRLQWRLVSAVDVEEIVLKTKVEDLQTLLDTVAFSEFDDIEVRTNTIDNIVKLVQLMQLVIEYLLQHQEAQYDMVRSNTKKIKQQASRNESLERRIEVLKEDVRTYQRQLHILRKSIQAGGGGINTELLFRLVQQQPKITRPEETSAFSDFAPARGGRGADGGNTTEIVKVLVDHEHDTRLSVHRMLEDQRKTFHAELTTLQDTVRLLQNDQQDRSQQRHQTVEYAMMLDALKGQVENTMRSLVDSLKQQQQQAAPQPQPQPPQQPDVAAVLKSAALEAFANELTLRERALEQREDTLRRQQTALQHAHQREDSLATKSATIIKRTVAVKLLFAAVTSVYRRRMLPWFSKWLHRHQHSAHAQEISSLVDRHAKALLYASERRGADDAQLQAAVQEEKHRVLVLQARLGAVQRELEALKESSALWERKAEQADRTEELLQDRLKQEKERAIVAQARVSAGTHRLEQEKAQLAEQLRAAQEVLAQQAERLADLQRQQPALRSRSPEPAPRPLSQDSAVMTSLDQSMQSVLSHGRHHRPSNPESSLLAGLPLGGSLSEDILLRQAQQRIQARADKETMQQMAMATLAQDFLLKLG